MNPPDQPTQPSETHKQLAADVFRMVHNRDLTAAAQLIADSEARAVAQLRSELNYAKASEALYHDEGTAAAVRAEKSEKLWKEFITLMEITEESDSGYKFNPNKISSCRAMDGKRLNEILVEARRIVF